MTACKKKEFGISPDLPVWTVFQGNQIALVHKKKVFLLLFYRSDTNK